MRFLSADLIFPISTAPIANGVIVISPNGVIKEVLDPDSSDLSERSRIERFDGILCPGMVNAHCHLELSHMKGVVEEKTGLPKFLTEIVSKRGFNAEIRESSFKAADSEMWHNGIQAVGDICNTPDTIGTKTASHILYHSFVELFSLDAGKVKETVITGRQTALQFKQAGLPVTIVPHAPYSVNAELFEAIEALQSEFQGPRSIHNQETESENEMFVSGTGKLIDTLQRSGADLSGFVGRNNSSLAYSLPRLQGSHPLILVHNSCTTSEEIEHSVSLRQKLFWCTCPSANLYIEDRIPSIAMWLETGATVCVGTDSLASNHELSIFQELKMIQLVHQQIGLTELLTMATLNGAKALGLQDRIGSFEAGKNPGVIWMNGSEISRGRLTSDCTVQRII